MQKMTIPYRQPTISGIKRDQAKKEFREGRIKINSS
jgi:hypothetical protein